ncbi:helix-turn-helix domain-containing protein [Xenorhabdus sp. 12]|uniref:Helix-turn-helix domain-containing protein n=1 Tax=Xenorhabdus santafensis TaxID=2582833 RepID=A0ABU4SEQ3_9GAMM|nr:XRE family transcriptional regulator [Xenorhabdus sp. 12]MDX7989287.1 helix-turn-helix domain-containing protein [Xenorhabdus sp. 12]
MKIDDYFKTRISLARQAANLTQGELADKVGVVRRQIAAYEAGDSKPRDKVLTNLATVLGTSSEWLAVGVGEEPNIGDIRKTVTLPEIPLYTAPGTTSPNKFYDADGNIIASPDGFIVAPLDASESAFAIKLHGDSMHSAHSPSFPHNSIITFEPATYANDRDFVLCGYGDSTFSFRQLIIEQGVIYLNSLNSQYINYPLGDDFKILGIAIHAQLPIPRNSQPIFAPPLWKDITSIVGKKNDINKRLDKIESMLEQLLNKKAP